jgi:hypothetical protein
MRRKVVLPEPFLPSRPDAVAALDAEIETVEDHFVAICFVDVVAFGDDARRARILVQRHKVDLG